MKNEINSMQIEIGEFSIEGRYRPVVAITTRVSDGLNPQRHLADRTNNGAWR